VAGARAGHEDQRAAGPDPSRGVPADLQWQQQMLVQVPAGRLEVDLGQRGVVLAAGRDHHVVNLPGQAGEEPLQGGGVGGVEGRGGERAEFGGGVLEPLGIAAGEDDVGSFVTAQARSLAPDARAAADHHDDLPR
jgi:hypothetical protein